MVNKLPRDSTIIFLLCFLALLVWLGNYLLKPDFLHSPDAAFYAEIAKNLELGRGAVTNIVFPAYTSYLSGPGPWASIYPPLFPLMIALSMLVWGVNDFSVAFTSGFFYLLTIIPLFYLAKKFFDVRVAVLASLWYIFTFVGYGLTGMAETFFTLLIILSLWFFFRASSFLFSGLLLGLAYLTKFQGALLLLPLLAFSLTKKGKFSSLLLLLGFIGAVFLKKLILPFSLDAVGGLSYHPFWTSLAADALYQTNQVPRLLDPVSLQTVLSRLDLILIKIANNAYLFFRDFFSLTLPPLVFLYLISFFKSERKKSAQEFKILSLILFSIFASFHLSTFFSFRYLHPLLPLIIIMAAATFLAFLEKFNPKKIFSFSLLFTLLFIILPSFLGPGAATGFQRALNWPRQPTVLYLLAKIAEKNTPKEAIIVSDRHAHLAWYGNRRSVLIPLTPNDLEKLQQRIPFDFLFLSDYFPEHYPEWQNLVTDPHDFADFKFVKQFEIKPEENYYRIPIKAVLYLKKKS